MNKMMKLYCRTYQLGFRTVMPLLPYRDVLVIDSLKDIPSLLMSKGYKKPLIITDSMIHSLGLIEPLKQVLLENELSFEIYDQTSVNPTVTNIEEARQIYIDCQCDSLIGFGGGSPIDCAKATGARIARKNKTIPQMKGVLKVIKSIPYLIAIPTTAGTGSETTLASVITDEKTNHKFAINDFALIPKGAVLDESLTKSLPRSLVSTTGMDALTHAIEAYIGKSTTKDTRKDALDALKLISHNLYTAYSHSENDEARKNMLIASFKAGRAFSKSYVGYCHAIAHSLGGKYHIAHGLANAVILPYVLKAYGSSINKKAKDIIVSMDLYDQSIDESLAADLLIQWILDMNKKMNIPISFDVIKEEDIEEMSQYAHKEANPLYPVPVLFDQDELKTLYYKIKEGNI